MPGGPSQTTALAMFTMRPAADLVSQGSAGAGHVEQAVQVEAHDLPPARRGGLRERDHRIDAGVVDQDVQAAEPLGRLGHRDRGHVRIGDVGGDPGELAAGLATAAAGRSGVGDVDPGHRRCRWPASAAANTRPSPLAAPVISAVRRVMASACPQGHGQMSTGWSCDRDGLGHHVGGAAQGVVTRTALTPWASAILAGLTGPSSPATGWFRAPRRGHPSPGSGHFQDQNGHSDVPAGRRPQGPDSSRRPSRRR